MQRLKRLLEDVDYYLAVNPLMRDLIVLLLCVVGFLCTMFLFSAFAQHMRANSGRLM